MNKKIVAIVFVILLLVIAALIIERANQIGQNEDSPTNSVTISNQIKRLKESDALQVLTNDLNIQIKDAHRRFKASDDSLQLGFYFRDLIFDQVVSIDANQNFMPASLLKLPLMIALLKKSEVNGEILNQTLKYTTSSDTLSSIPQRVLPTHQMIEGEELSVTSLINLMITESSNQATAMLLNQFGGPQLVSNALKEMDIIVMHDGDKNYLTPQTYAQLFVRLYRSTYLKPENSLKALQILSKSAFTRGIKGRLPKEINVANKFGERSLEDINQLHDCGVVFLPGNPYIACIMTKGRDFKMLEQFISEVSKITYDRMSRFYNDALL